MAELAFEDRGLIDEAKVGILAASVIAGGVGWTLLRLAPSVDEGPPIEEEEEGAADVTSGH
jgi:Na+/H+ antiporter NhaA